MMSLDNELKQAIDETVKLVTDTQFEVTKLGNKVSSYDEEKLNRMTTSAESAEKMQKMTLELEGHKKQMEALEKIALQPMTGKNSQICEKELAYRRSADSYLRFGDKLSVDMQLDAVSRYSKRFTNGDDRLTHKFANELVSGIDPSLGYLVLPDRSSKILSRFFETSPMRKIASVSTTASNRVEFLIDDQEASTAGWVGEVDDRSATTAMAELGKLTIDINEQFAQPVASQNLLSDASIDVETWLGRKLASKLGRVENAAFVVGGGASQPKGFMNETVYPAWAVNTSNNLQTSGIYERDKLETMSTISAGVIALEDLVNMQDILLSPYRPKAKWVMNRQTWGTLLKLQETTKRPLFSMQFLANGFPQMQLLGDPVVLASDVATIATNALVIAYGDFEEGYSIIDRAGISVIRNIYRRPGFVEFYTTKRVGAGVTSFDAIKRLKIT